jgi:hypothetical protein|tara:strand:- start:333 stop:1103 length:771 start_codon:yes stop_codon:yes gene_type:complete
MGIFRNITKSLKKAAPFIGSAIGMYFGGPLGASIGSGIGSLAAGRSAEEALQNAALAGATTYAMGGKDFGKGFNFSTSGSPFASREVVGAQKFGFEAAGAPSGIVKTAGDMYPAIQKSGSFFTSPTGIATLGLGALALGSEEEKPKMGQRRPDPVGKSRLGVGLIGDKAYDLDDEEDRKRYFEDLRRQQGVSPTEFRAAGGEVEGPGTGTSDSVPARLSDGEFVLTAKAVRGAGGGDRDLGAARMYDMMSKLERVA